MKELIVSGLEDSAVERLKKWADAHGWSLEEEVRHILTCGLDALDYAQAALSAIKVKTAEAAEAAAAGQEAAQSRRAKVEKMLNEARDRDAKLLEDFERDLGS